MGLENLLAQSSLSEEFDMKTDDLSKQIIYQLKAMNISFVLIYNQAYHLSGFQPDSPDLKYAAREADETANRIIECQVLAQMI